MWKNNTYVFKCTCITIGHIYNPFRHSAQQYTNHTLAGLFSHAIVVIHCAQQYQGVDNDGGGQIGCHRCGICDIVG